MNSSFYYRNLFLKNRVNRKYFLILNIKFLFDKIFCGDDDDLLSLKKFAIDDKNKQYLSKVVNYFKK